MSASISPSIGGGLSPAELKSLTDADGNFSVTTVQWQDAAKTASASTDKPATSASGDAAKPSSTEPSSENAKLAKDLLREARETKDPELKAELLKSAIDLLNTPGASGPKPAPGGSPAPSTDKAEPKKFEGDALKPYLDADGGNVEKGKDGGWAVGDAGGKGQKVDGEINRGQSLTFNTPVENKDNAGGTVELGKMFKGGPDGNHTEKARVTFRDENGKVVDEKVVDGTKDGNVSVTTDKNFASVEVTPEDNGAGGKHNNSDMTLKSVSLNPAGGSDGASAPKGASEARPAEAVKPKDDEEGRKVGQVLDLLGKVASILPGIGPVAGKALDLIGDLVDTIAAGKKGAN